MYPLRILNEKLNVKLLHVHRVLTYFKQINSVTKSNNAFTESNNVFTKSVLTPVEGFIKHLTGNTETGH